MLEMIDSRVWLVTFLALLWGGAYFIYFRPAPPPPEEPEPSDGDGDSILKKTVDALEDQEVPQRCCAQCGALEGHVVGGLSRCGKCKQTFYCSATCQRAGWPAHKWNCAAIAERGGQPLLTADSKAARDAARAAAEFLSLPKLMRATHAKYAELRENNDDKTGNPLFDNACGGAPKFVRKAVDAEAAAYWPDACAWAAKLGVAPCDVLFQQPPAAEALLAHLADTAFDGAFGESAPRPKDCFRDTTTALWNHPYFPDFRDPTPDIVARVIVDARDRGWLPISARILEVGAGNGSLCRALNARSPKHRFKLDGLNAPAAEAETEVAVAYGSSARIPWYGKPGGTHDERGYAKLCRFDCCDLDGLAAIGYANPKGQYDMVVSVSTFFVVGHPRPDGTPARPDEAKLGVATLDKFCNAVLKKEGLLLVATEKSPPTGHPAAKAAETLAARDFAVLRHGCGAAAGMPHRIYDLKFYGSDDDLTAATLEAEARLLMETGVITPKDANPFDLADPPADVLKTAVDHVRQGAWPRVFKDGNLNAPFWLLKKDRPTANFMRKDSDRHNKPKAPPPPADAEVTMEVVDVGGAE